eukprot:TRINITY_DN6703_c0_g1_i8.p1 TRINITY_DN6703_c0_g1~~TRINITY_DN6703_c0_g1_i8.p1  ORF type:complete len:280 (-),score=41.12 TRINITY_DN6703_c0_g1_i8:73-912(-)
MQQYKNHAKKLTGEELLITCDDDEYIEDAVPGPGYYHNDSLSTSIKTKTCPSKLQFFGSSALRFQPPSNMEIKVGPGDYDIRQKSFLNKKVTSKLKPPFNAKKPRFFDAAMNAMENPGPGEYNPKKYNRLNNKAQQGYQGLFGINERRFKDNLEQEELPGPGAYFTQNTHTIAQPPMYFLKGYQQNYYFMNQKNPSRSAFLPKPDENSPPIGTYELDYYNIGKKLQQNEDIDPELTVQVDGLGFNSSQPRFIEEKKKDEDDEDDDDDINNILHLSLIHI